jgi:hypothetical protein
MTTGREVFACTFGAKWLSRWRRQSALGLALSSRHRRATAALLLRSFRHAASVCRQLVFSSSARRHTRALWLGRAWDSLCVHSRTRAGLLDSEERVAAVARMYAVRGCLYVVAESVLLRLRVCALNLCIEFYV